MSRFYAGIGSRDTPGPVILTMMHIAAGMAERGFILRSGGAQGADRAFAEAVEDNPTTEIYLPWNGFNGCYGGIVMPSTEWSRQLVGAFHPNPAALSQGAFKLMERNAYQVLGPTPDAVRSEFIVCWTKDGGPSGGTGQALRIARYYDIPVFNLFFPDAAAQLYSHVGPLNG
jgi:hypothetical protein